MDAAAGEPASPSTAELRKQIWRRYRLELDKPEAEQDPAEIKRLRRHHLLLTEKFYEVCPATAQPSEHAAPTAASRRCALYPALLTASGPLLVLVPSQSCVVNVLSVSKLFEENHTSQASSSNCCAAANWVQRRIAASLPARAALYRQLRAYALEELRALEAGLPYDRVGHAHLQLDLPEDLQAVAMPPRIDFCISCSNRLEQVWRMCAVVCMRSSCCSLRLPLIQNAACKIPAAPRLQIVYREDNLRALCVDVNAQRKPGPPPPD